MTKDEIIKKLRDMVKYPTVTLPRDCEALKAAADLLAQPEQEYRGWYCAHCERGVDSSEVTYHEQHTVCGRVITDDLPPKAKPEQEPVAVVSGYYGGQCVILPIDSARIFNSNTALYTAPPQRKPLTDDEIERACVPLGAAMLSFTEVARAIEAAHGIKGEA